LQFERDGSTDRAGWFSMAQVDALDRVSLVDFARQLAGLDGPPPPQDAPTDRSGLAAR
jgi:hypothetical protein